MTIIRLCDRCHTTIEVVRDPEQDPPWECWCECDVLGTGQTAEGAVEAWSEQVEPRQVELFG